MLTLVASAAVFFQVSLFAPPPADARFPSPLDHVREDVSAAVRRFDQLWRQGWDNSLEQRTRTAPLSARQSALQHCHGAPAPRTQASIMYDLPNTMLITSVQLGHFRCPSWLGGTLGATVNETVDYDAMLTDEVRPVIRENRAQLISAVAQVRTRWPRDAALFGLHLRLAVDHGDGLAASAIVEGCVLSAAACALADGLVAERRGDDVTSDAAFSDPRIPAAWICADDDFATIYGQAQAARWEKLSCSDRRRWLDSLWWLADPFWSDQANQRRSAHYARRVMIELRGLSRRDERFAFDDASGGDALRKSLLWYGWPTVFAAGRSGGGVWSSASLDASHSGYLIGLGYRGANPEPYTTMEYQRDRVSFFPTLAMMADPYSVRDGDWLVNAPKNAEGIADQSWWPIEHWLPPRPVDDLPAGQTVFLRRDTLVHLATAHVLPGTDLVGSDAGSVVLMSNGPGDARRLPDATRRMPGVIVHRSDVVAVPTMLSVEVPRLGSTGLNAARARFGARPPEPLRVLAPRTLALSGPVLWHVTPESERLDPDPDLLLPFMMGSLAMRTPQQVGLYWETHGADPGDTLDVAVWIERVTGQGVIRTLGITLRVAQDLNTPVAVTWREPRPETSSYRVPGARATIARSLILDVSSLINGEYRVEIAVARPGSPPVRQATRIRVVR